MTLETISYIARFVFGIMWVIGLAQGIVAWVNRGCVIPRFVPITAAVAAGIGLCVSAVAFICGAQAGGMVILSLFIFPLMVYFGWFLLGCPGGKNTQRSGETIGGKQDQQQSV